jgi:hypothetical protein
MSDKTDKALDDNCPWLEIYVCEVRGENPDNRIVLHLEIDDDISYRLDLRKCKGLTDAEIDERFRAKFLDFVNWYADRDDCCFAVLEKLQGCLDDFK